MCQSVFLKSFLQLPRRLSWHVSFVLSNVALVLSANCAWMTNNTFYLFSPSSSCSCVRSISVLLYTKLIISKVLLHSFSEINNSQGSFENCVPRLKFNSYPWESDKETEILRLIFTRCLIFHALISLNFKWRIKTGVLKWLGFIRRKMVSRR